LQVAEYRAGEAGEAAPAAATPAQQAAQAAALQEASRPAPKVPPTKPLVEPAPELYTVHVPEGLRLIDLDLIKLAAQARDALLSRAGQRHCSSAVLSCVENIRRRSGLLCSSPCTRNLR
jgi:hypothetical protein